jgi:class 3 adenylate cyclase
MWIDPGYTQVLRRLSRFAHTVIFDARGLGLSDPLDHVPTVEEGADDLASVMNAARVERAVLLAMVTGYPAAAMFAARSPERAEGLVLVSPRAVGIGAVADTSMIAGYDSRMDEAMLGWQDAVEHHWEEGRTIELISRSIATNSVKRNWGMLERASAAPAMIRAVTQASLEIDLRDVLAAMQVPTIVVAREGSFQPRAIPEHVANLIPGAEFDWQPRWPRGEDDRRRIVQPVRWSRPSNRLRTRLHRGSAAVGIGVRAGLHTGECEISDGDAAGLAVHIGARVSALADSGQVLVSRTVKDLVVGSGLAFHSCGAHELKGVPGNWEIFALTSTTTAAVPVVPEQPQMRA